MAKLPKNISNQLEELGLGDALPLDPATSDLEPLTPDDKLEELSTIPINHQRFIEVYLRTGNRAKAYREVYPDASMGTSWAKGSALAKRYNWLISAGLENEGITFNEIARTLRGLLNDKNGKVRLGAVRIAYEQLHKSNEEEEEKKGVTNNTLVIIKDRQKGVFKVGRKSAS